MWDEMQRLRDCTELFQLLDFYLELGAEDRDTWHDRLTDFAGLQGRDLTRLYGELVAHGWLDQNTGVTPILEQGRHGGCYRITSAGQKAHKLIRKEYKEQLA